MILVSCICLYLYFGPSKAIQDTYISRFFYFFFKFLLFTYLMVKEKNLGFFFLSIINII